MLVCFGYLLGIVLRLLKTERADTLSGFYRYLQFQVKRILFGQLAGLFLRPLGILLPKGLNNHLHSIVSKIKGRSGIANLEPFPYFAYLDKVVVRTLPISVQKFYDEFWGSCSTAGNKAFFNYCKNTINSLDSKGAADIYASEALVRYVASMFYALAFSSCLVVAALIATARPEFSSFRPALWTFLCVYLVALEVILSNLRPLRAKEVELVFAATLLNYCSGEWPQP